MVKQSRGLDVSSLTTGADSLRDRLAAATLVHRAKGERLELIVERKHSRTSKATVRQVDCQQKLKYAGADTHRTMLAPAPAKSVFVPSLATICLPASRKFL